MSRRASYLDIPWAQLRVRDSGNKCNNCNRYGNRNNAIHPRYVGHALLYLRVFLRCPNLPRNSFALYPQRLVLPLRAFPVVSLALTRALATHVYLHVCTFLLGPHIVVWILWCVLIETQSPFQKKQCHSEIKTKPSSKNREFSKSRLLLIPWNIKIWVPSLTLVTHLQQISALRDNSTTRYGVNKFPSVTHVRTYEHHPSWA